MTDDFSLIETQIREAYAALAIMGLKLDQFFKDHNYCFNSNDDMRCDVDGGDCRGKRTRYREIRGKLGHARGHLSDALLKLHEAHALYLHGEP